MLRSREDFARLAEHGRTRADRLVVLHVLPNALDHDRYGIATGRRLGSAVTRNLVRRRVRHILRGLPAPGGRGLDVLIVLRPGSVEASFDELRAALERLLGTVRSVMATA
jgi:ribonuclease P protein component